MFFGQDVWGQDWQSSIWWIPIKCKDMLNVRLGGRYWFSNYCVHQVGHNVLKWGSNSILILLFATVLICVQMAAIWCCCCMPQAFHRAPNLMGIYCVTHRLANRGRCDCDGICPLAAAVIQSINLFCLPLEHIDTFPLARSMKPDGMCSVLAPPLWSVDWA